MSALSSEGKNKKWWYLGRTDGFAELAGNAALFSIRIPPQSVFTPKARTKWPFLEWIVDCNWLPEKRT